MKTFYLTLSRVFPDTHPRAGEYTMFKEKLLSALKTGPCIHKIHTIRANYEFWAKRFEKIMTGEAVLSVREWIGKPYAKGSSQHEIARLTREDGIGIQMLELESLDVCRIKDATSIVTPQTLALNDGLHLEDWKAWFKDYDLTKPMAVIHFTRYRY